MRQSQDVGKEREHSRVFPSEFSDIWLKGRPKVAWKRKERGVNGTLSVSGGVCVNLEMAPLSNPHPLCVADCGVALEPCGRASAPAEPPSLPNMTV